MRICWSRFWKNTRTSLWNTGQRAPFRLCSTRKFVAYPGCSEHQTGLAIDLGANLPEIDFICPEFPDTGIFGKFREKAADFGFIERYPKGKEAVTGIGAEPWHFRYVGVPHAAVMKAGGLVLEEYAEERNAFGGGVK